MKFLSKTCILIVLCVIIFHQSEAGRFFGGGSRSRPSSSRPSSSSWSRPRPSPSRPSSSYRPSPSKPSYPTQQYRPSSHPSFPAVSRPSYPTSSHPSFPAVSKPSYPTQQFRPSSHPSFPAVSKPSYPTSSHPSFPAVSKPSYPTNTGNTGFRPAQSHPGSNTHRPFQQVPSAPHPPPTGQHYPNYAYPKAPQGPTGAPARPIGWITPTNTAPNKLGSHPQPSAHVGYGNSGNRNQGLNKVGATHVTSSMPHGPSTSNANYPRQQYGVGSTHYTQPNQPHVVNNYITNNHPPRTTFIHSPGVYHSPPAYHFTTYHHYPSYYSPFHDYHPVNSFGLGLAIGSLSHHHHHYNDYYHDRPSVHYHSNTYNTYENRNGNGDNGGNNNGYNPNDPQSNNNGGNNFNNNNSPNNQNNQNYPNNPNNPNNVGAGPYQNMQNINGTNPRTPFEQPPPLVYTIPEQGDNKDADSTEIIFTNPYVVVGVESLLLYGELHDDEDIKILIQQESDGLEPYPWNQLNPIDVASTTSAPSAVNGTNQSSNNMIGTTTIKPPMNTNPTPTTSVPLAPLAPVP